MRLRKVTAGLSAAAVLLAVVAGVPTILIAIGAAPTSVPSLEQIRHALFATDQNTQVVFAGLGAVVWFCWAAFTLSTVREIAAAISTRGQASARPLPHLEWVGRPAAHLVAAVALLFVAAPGLINATAPTAAAAPATSTAPAMATSTATAMSASSRLATQPDAATPAIGGHNAHGTAIPSRGDAAATTYTVKRRDTLWSIAETHLGDPQRWPELARLNPGVVGPAPDFRIRAGDTLQLVSPSGHSHGGTVGEVVVVQAGDTLSGIAADHGVGQWRAIWPGNHNRPQPGGRTLNNPNHIEPGWTLALPGASRPSSPSRATPAPSPSPTTVPPLNTPAQAPPPRLLRVVPEGLKAGAPARESHPGAVPPALPATPPLIPSASGTHRNDTSNHSTGNHSTSNAGADHADAETDHTVRTPAGAGTSVVAFTGGGALLAAGAMGALLAARRRQHRNRRPGRTIATTAPDLIGVEKAVVSHGRPALAAAAFIDAALRTLSAATAADPDGQLPDVVALRHGGGQVSLRLAGPHPGPVPPPWAADETGVWWSISTEQELPVTQANAGNYLAPLPTLTAIGRDDQGYAWLLDLEGVASIALTGDPGRCLDLARYLAAELSVNTWSDDLGVTLVGFGEELVEVNPERLRYSCDLDAAVLALTVDAVDAVDACTRFGQDVRTGRVRDICADTFMPHVLLVAPGLGAPGDKLADLMEIVTTQRGRAAMCIVLAGDSALSAEATWSMHISDTGRLSVPELGLDLIANQLPAGEAMGVSQMLGQAAYAADEPMPAAGGDQPWQAYCDAAGALQPAHTLPRNAPEQSRQPIDGEVTTTSLLPLPDQTYLDRAATTPEDLATLAPRVPATTRTVVEAADHTLDQDLDAWWDPNTVLPRLTLLGPVQLRAHGQLEKNRVGFYTEIVAYLATCENGATLPQFETAFNLQPARARSDIRVARNWLGINPRTGRKHLPDALKSKSGQAQGVGVYELEDVLVDAHLFRRLRLRGQARGDEGISDLALALSLVSGAPFDQLRSMGYEWLIEGVRIDHHLVASIVDVAHVVATRALGAGDVEGARAAVEVAQLAAPYEEGPKLDMVAVRKAEGHLSEAENYLRDEVCNRSDDGRAPEDLSERTQTILRHRKWLTRAG